MSDIELQPEADEVLQMEANAPEPAVAVTIHGPVRTQELPHKAGSTRTRTVGTSPLRILAADHRRARAVLVSVGQIMLVAFSATSAQDPSFMALWPQNVPFVVTTATEVWVASLTGTTSIAFATEDWAAGQGGE